MLANRWSMIVAKRGSGRMTYAKKNPLHRKTCASRFSAQVITQNLLILHWVLTEWPCGTLGGPLVPPDLELLTTSWVGELQSLGVYTTTPIHSLGVSTNRPRLSVSIHYCWVCPPTAQVVPWALWPLTTPAFSLQDVFVNHPSTSFRGCRYHTCSLLSKGAPSVNSPIYCQMCLVVICAWARVNCC